MQIKKSKHFVLTVGVVFLSCTLLYIVSFHLLVSKDIRISHSYKHFLLEYTNSPRLIIDSGSNSLYGINSNMLEKELGRLTINLADNISYPLKHKLLRIEHYANAGDVVLLPLEWYQYGYKEMPPNYLKSIFDHLNYYYNSLPWIEKFELIAKTPFSGTVKALFRSKKFSGGATTKKQHREYRYLLQYEEKFKNLERGDLGNTNKTVPVVDGVNIATCDLRYMAQGLAISNQFRDNSKIIKRIQKKGVEIVFTWPNIADEFCYKGKGKIAFNLLVNEIKEYMNTNKIPLIAEPEDSLFSRKYMLDVYYHINIEGRDIRTKKLIQVIENSKISKRFEAKSPPPYKLNIPFSSVSLKKHLWRSLNTVGDEELVRFGRKHNRNNVIPLEGWVALLEKHSMWSNGDKSSLLIRLGKSLIDESLKMEIVSFHYKATDKSKTEVFINGKSIGSYLLAGKNEMVIPEEIVKLEGSGKLRIEFHYTNVKSPFEHGDSLDRRKLKLMLLSLRLKSLEK